MIGQQSSQKRYCFNAWQRHSNAVRMPPGNIPRSLEKYRSNPGEQDAANQVKSASKREASKIDDVGKRSCRPRMKCNEMNRRMTRRSMYRIKDVLIEKCRPHRMREVSPRWSNCSMHDHRHGHLFESARETPPVYPVCRKIHVPSRCTYKPQPVLAHYFRVA